ncbi:hypothetical protein NP493_16g03018 [Ridgeia piscesae]|uniref:Uncharacterized protein n=1 Tax=Ridgeia piscesae TaxID=27915 RepID=A0AAD9PEC9_RIDPI|nr:hypothetical protein NP493_16g03018 [Ridgeia piscesae]
MKKRDICILNSPSNWANPFLCAGESHQSIQLQEIVVPYGSLTRWLLSGRGTLSLFS